MTRPTEDFYFERPQTSERVHVGRRLLPSNQPRLFTGKPRIGLVISTYGAPAYVELGLAARRLLYGNLPVLVHDDCSPAERDVLARLCDKYGRDSFQSNSSSLGHEMGDLSGIVGGLYWAKSLGLDLLVKMSRRCIPLSNWTTGLQALAEASQYGTFGRRCEDYGLSLRTECFAMAVEPWSRPEIAGEIAAFMLKNRTSLLVEQYLFQFVLRVYEINCEAARQWEHENVLRTPRPAFVDWPFLSEGRRRHSANYLWHETAPPEAYQSAAAAIGLSFAPDAFHGIISQGRK